MTKFGTSMSARIHPGAGEGSNG